MITRSSARISSKVDSLASLEDTESKKSELTVWDCSSEDLANLGILRIILKGLFKPSGVGQSDVEGSLLFLLIAGFPHVIFVVQLESGDFFHFVQTV